jgi:uroporphyrinogen-III synthase
VSQAADLVRAVEAAGGIAMTFPLLEILPRDAKLVSAEESKLPPPDILIYVSPNAVLHGARWHEPDAMAIAVGPATLGCLKRRGVSEAVSPGGGFDSESLLADAALARVAGKHVRIVRGQDGRELLGETLRDRGAIVDYLSVYLRQARPVAASDRRQLEKQLGSGEISCITVMSVVSLHCLLDLFAGPKRGLLTRARLVTPSRRVLKNINELLPGARATLAPGPQAGEMILGLSACLKQDNSE